MPKMLCSWIALPCLIFLTGRKGLIVLADRKQNAQLTLPPFITPPLFTSWGREIPVCWVTSESNNVNTGAVL